MRASSAASVVDLPDPVAPVTSTRPCGRRSSAHTAGGAPRCSSAGACSGNQTNGRRRTTLLAEYIHPATAAIRQARAKSHSCASAYGAGFVHHRMQQGAHLGRQTAPAGNRADVAMHAQQWRQAGGQMQVRGVLAAGKGEKIGDFHLYCTFLQWPGQSFPTLREHDHRKGAPGLRPVEGLYHDNQISAARHARAAGAGRSRRRRP